MKKEVLLIIFLFALVLITACEQFEISNLSNEDLARISEMAIVCNAPYMRYAVECCLDQNDNKICDRDERDLTTEEKDKEKKANKETPSGILPPVKDPPSEPTKPDTSVKDYISFSGKFDTKRISDVGWVLKVSDKYVVYTVPNIYNIKTSETKELNFSVRSPISYNLYKNKLVYATVSGDINIYNIDTNQHEKITDVEINDYGTHTITNFNINENYVIWEEPKNNIFLYDFKKDEKIKLVDTTGSQPRLYNNKVVWLDVRNTQSGGFSNADIYMYDIKTKKEQKVIKNTFNDLDLGTV